MAVEFECTYLIGRSVYDYHDSGVTKYVKFDPHM